jgi:hypothetical protein
MTCLIFIFEVTTEKQQFGIQEKALDLVGNAQFQMATWGQIYKRFEFSSEGK